MTPEASPVTDFRREDEVEIEPAERQQAEEELHSDGDGPTHHPSAPPDELFDITTTVDPSYIISLIRKLLPVDGAQADDFQNLATDGVENQLNGKEEGMDTQHAHHEQSPHSSGRDGQVSPGNCKKSVREEAWEESGCILWDLAANKEHAEFMVQNLVVEVLLANLITSGSVRIKEISIGIIGNLTCHDSLMERVTTANGLLEAIIDQVFSDDSPCLCELFRLLTLGFQGCQCAVWAKALQSENILSRVLWIAENTLNPILIERSVGFLLAIMENQQEVAPLLPALIKLGMPSLLVNLLAFEKDKLMGERLPERYPALDSILRAIEALSVIDDYSEKICSNKELFFMTVELVKISDKNEISSSCVTAAVLIANILADATDLALEMSNDFLFLESLFGLFPFTSDDYEAKNALWSIFARLLTQLQETKISPLSLSQFVQMLTSRSELIEDVLLDGEGDNLSEKHEISTTAVAKLNARAITIKRIINILNQWNLIKKDLSVEQNEENPIERNRADDKDIQKILGWCLKHVQ